MVNYGNLDVTTMGKFNGIQGIQGIRGGINQPAVTSRNFSISSISGASSNSVGSIQDTQSSKESLLSHKLDTVLGDSDGNNSPLEMTTSVNYELGVGVNDYSTNQINPMTYNNFNNYGLFVDDGNYHNQIPKELPPKRRGLANAINGREVSDKILHVGNLDKTIQEFELISIFQKYGSIKYSKVLQDKNNSFFNYAFVEFIKPEEALKALNALNGLKIGNSSIKVNFAYRSTNANSVQSTQPVFNIFVGDLSPEINDEILFKNFEEFNPREAHVMWDMKTLRSRGYGFVTFLNDFDAKLALTQMNGKKINGRIIRCNWASHKQKQSLTPPPPPNVIPCNQIKSEPVSNFEIIYKQTPTWQTTVYIGNLANFTTDKELIPIVNQFGFILELKIFNEKNCAFVKYDSHESATFAIVNLSGYLMNNRPIKCGWGKDKPVFYKYNA
ncbi:hypothetical protein CLIB1444_21S01068 [[Candida] jaroonii]|uniref:Uncharacterized protein n=1 Tax=[Candida] jaroonii TaxID=467808 RepID=A0ACA9YFJ1_9ASCO|nr:hypothetical protein CLIB1444_21S01068 [[Candida] jaroonii]